jgi:hypothetical protein
MYLSPNLCCWVIDLNIIKEIAYDLKVYIFVCFQDDIKNSYVYIYKTQGHIYVAKKYREYVNNYTD